mmetsp:Transcript_33838/g.79089  ORF Transcript_33838/g.79089 Transcript_33838/m.79089 type:complete len:1025 (-) Transcript_33838:130-3204(-)
MAEGGGLLSRGLRSNSNLLADFVFEGRNSDVKPSPAERSGNLREHSPSTTTIAKLTFQQHLTGLAEEFEKLQKANLALSNHNAALRLATNSANLVEVDGLDSRPPAQLPKARSVRCLAGDADLKEVALFSDEDELVVDMDMVGSGSVSESQKVQALMAKLPSAWKVNHGAMHHQESFTGSADTDISLRAQNTIATMGTMGSRLSLDSAASRNAGTQASKHSVSSIDEATEGSHSTTSRKRSHSKPASLSALSARSRSHAVQNWKSLVGSLLRSNEGQTEEAISPRSPERSRRHTRPLSWSTLALTLGGSPRTHRRGSQETSASFRGSLSALSASASRDMLGIRSRGNFEPELWPEWLQVNMESAPTVSTSPDVLGMYNALAGMQGDNATRTHSKGSIAKTTWWPQRWALLPSSPPRLAWDLVSLLILGFDAIFIPLAAFGLPDYDFIVWMMWITTVFWSLDIGASFMTGFHHNGMVELRPSRIIVHYLKTWFVFDFFIIACDWLVLSSRENSVDVLGIVRVGKSFRLTRVLRAMRLLRILRILRTIETLWYFATSEIDSMIFTIGKFMIGMLFVNHFVACSWYAVGTIDLGDGSRTWVDAFEERSGEDATILLRYTTAFHWSITQMTPASMEVNGQNYLERIFTVCVIVMSLILISSIVSSITSAVTQLRKLSFEKSKQQELVRSFIGQKSLSLELGNRIWTFLQKHYTSSVPKRALHEQDVAFFKLMPDSLRVSLHVEMFLPLLMQTTFFISLQHTDAYTLVRICHVAMTEKSLSMNQELFSYCELALGMYFTIAGTASYFKALSESNPIGVGPRATVSSVALWIQWQHRGRLVARSNCEFVLLDSAQFRSVVSQHPCANYCKIYAEIYRDTIVQEHSRLDGDLHDMWNNFQVDVDIVRQAQEEWENLVAMYDTANGNLDADAELRPSRRGSYDSGRSSDVSLGRYWLSPSNKQITPTSFAQQVTSWLRGGTGAAIPPSPSNGRSPPSPSNGRGAPSDSKPSPGNGQRRRLGHQQDVPDEAST